MDIFNQSRERYHLAYILDINIHDAITIFMYKGRIFQRQALYICYVYFSKNVYTYLSVLLYTCITLLCLFYYTFLHRNK